MFSLQKLSDLKGKNRALAAFLLGICATLALPPFFILPMLAVSVCGWFTLVNSAPTRRQALWVGWFWGLGFFMSGLYWMCISLLVDAEKFAWLIPFCLIGLNGIIAIYPALASGIFWTLSRKFSLPHHRATLLFVCCWSATEFARSYLFTGFPWNLVGYAWAVWTPAMQSVSVIGIHGLTLLTMILAISPLWLHAHRKWFRLTWVIFAGVLIWGAMRIPAEITNTQTQIRVVQAAIPQSLKWDPKARIQGIRKHFELSKQDAEIKPDIIIWPESAAPLAINQEPLLIQDLASAIKTKKGALITGGLRIDDKNYYNSIYAITKNGIAATYDKHHLVPFGEFVPFRNILPLDKITPGDTDFSSGIGPVTIDIPEAPPFTPLICYEAIFPEDVDRKNNPQWILNLTNDAWFGRSTGPYQHFHMTRFRAIEVGLPLVRAANTGISAMIDPYGRVIKSLGLNESDVLDAALPEPAKTPYFHKFTYLIYLALLCLFGAISFRRRDAIP